MTTIHTRPASTLAVGDVMRWTRSPEPGDHEYECVMRVTRQDAEVIVDTDGSPQTSRRRFHADREVTVVEDHPDPLTDMDELHRLAVRRRTLLEQADAATDDLRRFAVDIADAYGKARTAEVAGISRPTLDAWIAQDRPADPDGE